MSRSKNVILNRRYFGKGEMVIHEGDDGNCAYLIQSGSVRVFTVHNEREIEFTRLHPGDIFGEMALIYGGKRTASIQAVDPCNLIVISRSTFEHKIRRSDPTIRAIVRMMSERVKKVSISVATHKPEFDSLEEAIQEMYRSMSDGLIEADKSRFRDQVLDKLEDFLTAVREFEPTEDVLARESLDVLSQVEPQDKENNDVASDEDDPGGASMLDEIADAKENKKADPNKNMIDEVSKELFDF